MNDEDLSDLERRLAMRPTLAPSVALRALMLSNLARARRREQVVPLSALVAVCAAGLILSLPVISSGSSAPIGPAVEAWRELAEMGLDGDALPLSQSFLAQARLPRIAPPLGSDPGFFFPSEAR